MPCSRLLGLDILTTMDNGMIVYNRDVNAFAFKRSDEWINALILCAMRAENVIDDFDAKDGIAGSDGGIMSNDSPQNAFE